MRATVLVCSVIGLSLAACSKMDAPQRAASPLPASAADASAVKAKPSLPPPAPVAAVAERLAAPAMATNVQGLASPAWMPPPTPESREQYRGQPENEVKSTQAESVSTLSLDVDTGSYSNIRRMLRAGQLPPVEAVRIEELLNYFPYADSPPPAGHPFSISTEVAPAPWQRGDLLLRVGVRAVDVAAGQQHGLCPLCSGADVLTKPRTSFPENPVSFCKKIKNC